MVTIGRGLHASVHEFFEGVRSYDPKRAVAVLADDVDFDSPWSGHLHGKAAVEAFLKTWLGDAKTRPSITISDVAGDGAVSRLKVSVSGRFGKAPELYWLNVLRVQSLVHHASFVPAKGHH
ncbi:MAG: nuclear transport factor 2 family protein [Thermoplasmatota archaeon]